MTDLDGISCPMADIVLEKLPHFVAQRHDLIVTDDVGRFGTQAESCAREELIRRDLRTVGPCQRG